ncbi:MAG: response regulator [Deltaproteobacteria bacterium]|nr:response regulator [Deltaproteobacteria bacterium]
MKNILVVSGDEGFLQILKKEFQKFSDQYRLFVAGDGPNGLNILKAEAVDLVAMTLLMPKMDGIQFLTYLRRIDPSVPIVIMVSEEATYMGDVYLKMGVLQVLVEPVSTDQLIECIQEILFLKSQEGRLQGISLVNFLQLMEMEKKTYLLEVLNHDGGKGLFYFHEGELYDALYGELNGPQAALKMINWDHVEIRFRTPPTEKIRKRIQRPLMSLLMDATLIRDEKAHASTKKEKAVQAEVSKEPGLESTVAAPIPEQKSETPRFPAKDVEDGVKPDKTPAAPDPKTIDQLLQELLHLRGVRAVFRLGQDGTLVSEMGSWSGADASQFAKALIMVHGGADRMVRELRVTPLQTLTLEADGVVIMYLPSGENLLAILANDSKMLGVIRQKALKTTLEMERLS